VQFFQKTYLHLSRAKSYQQPKSLQGIILIACLYSQVAKEPALNYLKRTDRTVKLINRFRILYRPSD